jgi:uncharacterized Zn finger protein
MAGRRGYGGDEWQQWGGWERTTPRRAVGGIKAQTQRGKFGATWWASRWLAALENLVDVNRLSRGRSYARSGQVTKLDVSTQGVDARVQGSRATPYKVTIRFRTLSDAEWDAVVDAMAEQAVYAARLLAGEMPDQIEEVFQVAGVTLFPAGARDLETDCSCPDWANPCKHVAAVIYLLGERFDVDPFLMFELRGRTKDGIVAALRARRAGATEAGDTVGLPSEPLAGADPYAGETAPLLVETDQENSALVERFWSSSSDLTGFPISLDAPPIDALPVKVLGAPPFWRDGAAFTTQAERAYRAISQRAHRLATEGK